jgi:hypothetical protein
VAPSVKTEALNDCPTPVVQLMGVSKKTPVKAGGVSGVVLVDVEVDVLVDVLVEVELLVDVLVEVEVSSSTPPSVELSPTTTSGCLATSVEELR